MTSNLLLGVKKSYKGVAGYQHFCFCEGKYLFDGFSQEDQPGVQTAIATASSKGPFNRVEIAISVNVVYCNTGGAL
jgi:hypothetical protein